MGESSSGIPAPYKLESYRYDIGEELIAKEPIEPRDHARLLVYYKSTGQIEHRYFYELPSILPSDVVLVANTSKVFMARTFAKKVGGSTDLEVLFIRNSEKGLWETLLRPAKRVQLGQKIAFLDGSQASLVSKEDGVCVLDWDNADPQGFFDTFGHLPLPPYLAGSKAQKADYQTIYAHQIGSSAAPTAGLHFTEELWQKLTKRHTYLEVCLHVGLGTFKPIQVEDIREHPIHSEYIELAIPVANELNGSKKIGKKICAIGTTSLRTLESCYHNGVFTDYKGTTNLYLYPDKGPKAVDMLITNFHTPESSLLVLVASMIGVGELHRIYREAMLAKYRFFSFGDAMIIV